MKTNSPELNNSFPFPKKEEIDNLNQTTKMLEFLSVAKEIVEFSLATKNLN